jgi:hypothetical protein
LGEVETTFQGRGPRSGEAELPVALEAVLSCLPASSWWGGTVVGAERAALFSCQVGQWKGEVTAVISTLPTEARVSG